MQALVEKNFWKKAFPDPIEARSMRSQLEPQLRIWERVLEKDCTRAWRLQLLSGKPEYLDLHQDRGIDIAIYALLSGKHEAYTHITTHYNDFMSELFKSKRKDYFVFQKSDHLLHTILKSIVTHERGDAKEYQIISLFKSIALLGWYEGLNILSQYEPSLWNINFHYYFVLFKPIHYIAAYNIDLLDTLHKNAETRILLNKKNKYYLNIAATSVLSNNYKTLDWISIHRPDMLDLCDCYEFYSNLLRAIKNRCNDALKALIKYMHQTIETLEERPLNDLLNTLIDKNRQHLSLAITQKKSLVCRTFFEKCITNPEKPLEPDFLAQIIQIHSETLDVVTYDMREVSPCSDMFLDLLTMVPDVLSLHIVNLEDDYDRTVCDAIAAQLTWNLLNQFCQKFWLISGLLLPEIMQNMVSHLQGITGLYITGSSLSEYQETIKIEPQLSQGSSWMTLFSPKFKQSKADDAVSIIPLSVEHGFY